MSIQNLSEVSYKHWTIDPHACDIVEVPDMPALPTLIEPDAFPSVPDDAAGSSEELIDIDHPRIDVLSIYARSGWDAATLGARMRSGAAQRLYRVADSLPDRFGLAVFDSHRPLALQQEIYDAAYRDESLPPGFVSVPSADPTTPPPHLTGGTVDLTLTYDGQALALGTDFDDFSDLAFADAFESQPGLVRDLRRLLYWSMRAEEFSVINCEWWHFEYGTRRWATLRGTTPLYHGA